MTEPSESLERRIVALLESERYGVLCLGGEAAYGALVAFRFETETARVLFSTPVTTRKYQCLKAVARVAFVVDDRSSGNSDVMGLEAVTLLGAARELDAGEPWEAAAAALIERHPHLESFVRAPSCALFEIAISNAVHVGRFQEVHQWSPKRSG